MVAVFVVLDGAITGKDVHQPGAVSVNEQAESLLLVIRRDQMVFVCRLNQVTRIPEMPGCCLTASGR